MELGNFGSEEDEENQVILQMKIPAAKNPQGPCRLAILKELQLNRAIFNWFGAFAAIHLGLGMPLNVFAFAFRFIHADPCPHLCCMFACVHMVQSPFPDRHARGSCPAA